MLKQFRTIKESIDLNIATLKNLVQQSIELEDLIATLSSTNASQETQSKLSEVKSQIDKDIENLVEITQRLFRSYEELVKII